MFKLLSTASEKACASTLVAKLKSSLPPTSVEIGRKGATVNRITRLLERIYESAAAYQSERRLGFFRRAALANHFKWELRNQGYPQEFAEVATEGLVMELSKRAAQAKQGGK